MTEHVAVAVLQWDREIGLRTHLLQRLALCGEHLLDAIVEGNDLAAEHVLARRASERIVEVLLHVGAVPHGQDMHSRIAIAEARDECVLRVQRERETSDQLAKECGTGLGRRTFVYQPQYVQVLLFHRYRLRCRCRLTSPRQDITPRRVAGERGG